MGRILRAPVTRAYALASKIFPAHALRELGSRDTFNSASHRAMLEAGLIEYAGSSGFFHLLPLATRALEKLSKIICEEMDAIGAQRIQMPSLCEKKIFEKAGRLDVFGKDLLRLADRTGKEYCLAPTHEESVTHLVAGRLHYVSATSSTPILLYQLTPKFRDEQHSQYGLLRCREFLMKDLYSFDVDETEAKKTYELCSEAYDRVFNVRLAPSKSQSMRVLSDVGAMGGSLSHEYHFQNDCGSDRIDFCHSCNTGVNRELVKKDDGDVSKCSSCQSEMKTYRTVEVGHTFILGTKYSEAFDAYFATSNGNKPAYMGCYGIGVTRLLATLIDINLNKKQHIRWPLAITPYTVCLIPPKTGSKEETAGATKFAYDAAEALCRLDHLHGEVVLDDRSDMTVGRKLVEAKKTGYPVVIVANKSVLESTPKFEFFDLTEEGGEGKAQLLTHEELFGRLRQLECGT